MGATEPPRKVLTTRFAASDEGWNAGQATPEEGRIGREQKPIPSLRGIAPPQKYYLIFIFSQL